MKALLALVISILAFSAVAAELDRDLLKAIGNDRTRWIAHSNGAEAKECFRVVDSEGNPLTNANIRCAFKVNAGASGLQDVYGVTDTNGLCMINGMCKAYMDYSVEKEGYYCSYGKVDYMGTTRVPAVIDGKWQPYGELRTVVLKIIKTPWSVKVLTGDQCHRQIPKFDSWLGFDFERGDWLPPFGIGKFEDVLVRFQSSVRKRNVDFTHVMEVSFTNNPYAGVYQMRKDPNSDLKSSHLAKTNAEFEAELIYVQEKLPKMPRRWNFLDNDSYLVFRTRTRVDDKGNLIGAHYGKIYGYWCSDDQEMTFCGGCFNQVENDPNIEGDQTLHYAIRNYKNKK